MKISSGYSRFQIALHWAIVVLIAVNYVVSDDMGKALRAVLKGEIPEGLTPVVHVWVGLSILALVAVRLIARLVHGAPAPVEGGSPLMERAASLAHLALYVLLFAVPVLGALAWFQGFGFLGDVHVVAMNIMLAIAGLHALAALYHQYVLKDGLLLRMMRPE